MVGIVGRIVKEKGFAEFAETAKIASVYGMTLFFSRGRRCSSVGSGRDGSGVRSYGEAAGLSDRFRFTGFTNQVAEHFAGDGCFCITFLPRGVPPLRSGGNEFISACHRNEYPRVPARQSFPERQACLYPPGMPPRWRRLWSICWPTPNLPLKWAWPDGRGRRVCSISAKWRSVSCGSYVRDFRAEGSKVTKRIFDAAISLLLLLPAVPVMALIAAVTLARDGFPVLFVQERAGQSGRPFRLYKVRTMSNATDASGEPLPDAERLTLWGKFLRASS